MKKYSGFTLVELLITIAVLGIVTAVALPSFDDLMKRNRVTTVTNNLLASLKFARGESVSRNVLVQVSPLIAGNDWSGGWEVRADLDGNGSYTDANELLRAFDGVSSHSTIILNTPSIIFEPSGEAITPGNTVSFNISANACTSGKEYIRQFNMLASGVTEKITKQSC